VLQAFGNILKIPDLRKKIFFTFMIIAIYRVGTYVPTPGIDGVALARFFQQNMGGGNLLGFMGMFTGGALQKATIFALGIMPYISSSIILQLLTVVIPALEKMAKEGEEGRKKIIQLTRYGTIILSILQTFFIALAREPGRVQRHGHRSEPRLGFPAHVYADHDDRHGFHHVAR